MTLPTWLKFPKLTLSVWLKLASLLLTLADAALAYGDKIGAVPGVPGWLAHYWPQILIAAAGIHQAASVFGIKPTPPAQIQAAVQKAIAEATTPSLITLSSNAPITEAAAAAAPQLVPPKQQIPKLPLIPG